MKHTILVNPISGNKKGKIYAIRVKELLKKNNINANILTSKFPKYFTKVVHELALKEKYRFYVLGGDGTLNEVASGIVNTSSEIVVIPCGTGNDFVRSISKYFSMRKIINESLKLNSTPTDILKYSKDKYCINILNMGFDAMIANNVNKFRNIPFISGTAKYNLSIIYTLSSSKNYIFKIRCNNNVLKGKFTLAAIANGSYYGGGIKPCPDALVNDGKIDSCIIDTTTLMTKLKLLPKYKKGKHTQLPQVHFFKSDEISIVSNTKFPISVDGEIYYTNRLHIKILHNAINIVHII